MNAPTEHERQVALQYFRNLRPALFASHLSTTIDGAQLATMLDLIDEQAAAIAELEAKKAPRAGKAKLSWTEPLADVIPIINDVLLNHAECWGQTLPDALAAYEAQADEQLPEPLKAAIGQALGNGD